MCRVQMGKMNRSMIYSFEYQLELIYANEYLTCIRSFLLYGIDATKYIHYFFTRILKLRFNVLKSSSQKMFQKLRTPKLSHFQSVLLRKKCVPRLQDEHI